MAVFAREGDDRRWGQRRARRRGDGVGTRAEYSRDQALVSVCSFALAMKILNKGIGC
jgi:hypothetical protein